MTRFSGSSPVVFWKWEGKIRHAKPENVGRYVQMGISVNKHPYACCQVRWRATENRSESCKAWQKDAFETAEFKFNLNGKKKDSTSFCFPSKIWLWHVDHSENKRHPAKERNTVLDKHINKESVPGLPENSSVQPMPASDELFLPFIAKWKKVRTSFTSCIYLNDSIIFLDYVFPFFCHCCKYSFLLDKIMRVNDSWIDFLL